MADLTIRPAEQFREFLEQGRFMIQRARSSGMHVFYPRVAEPRTGETGLEWIEASGNGVVYSTTVQRNRPPAPDSNLALIELAEGPRMLSRVIGVAPDEVKIGMAVQARILDEGDGPFVVFQPEDAA